MPLQQHLQAPDRDTAEGTKVHTMLVAMGSSLGRKFHDYKSARFNKDREWETAIKQYEGDWDSEDLSKLEYVLSSRGMSNDPISVNITRPKTNIAIARMKDIQFPTGGDFNFYIKPAPLTPEQKAALTQNVPDGGMQMAAAQQGVPQQQLPAPAELAEQNIERNTNNAPKMERHLRNRMIYADYGRKARLAIEDLCIKGAAVVKGPTIQDRKYRHYEAAQASTGETIQMLRESFVPEPNIERVDPLYFFPDPSARLPNEMEDAFELHPMSTKDLIELSKNPAFMAKQINDALAVDPDVTDIPDIVNRTSREDNSHVNNRYWVHEYRGPLDKEVLYLAGMISEKDYEDNLYRPVGEVWNVNKTIIRMSLSHIDGEDSLPYGVAVWEKDPNNLFGHGMPHLLRDAQRTVNNAYLMLLDNASLTSGPQIVLNKSMIEPATRDEDYGIEPMKVWFLTEYGMDVREAMQFIDVPAQMQGISQIIDTAMQFADIESSTPLLQQGEVPSGNNTTTGIAMVMSATNIVQKAASMDWDDYITKPLVNRFYHYEMQYGEDDDIKGDFEIEVGGATERIEAQIRSQEIEKMLGLAGSNEEFMMQVDSNKAFRALVDNTRTGDVLRSEEEVEQLKAEQAQQSQEQPDPETIKAQAAMITAQARAEEAKANAQLKNAEQELAAKEMQARYQSQVAEAMARNNEAALQYQLGLAELAAKREMSVQELQKELALKNMDSQLQLQLKEIDFDKMEREIEVKEEYGTGI